MAQLSSNQKKLFEALHNSRSEDFKTFNKKDYRGVWSSIIDKYPESAHFVYELLQNADDAEATDVEIILTRDRMIFKHNGLKHFDITEEGSSKVGDINSITGIGDSSKSSLQNKIGKFGVGFKAVFQYTDTPEIYDDFFKFKIENYIVPTLLEYDHPLRQEGETLFVFPFKKPIESYKEIQSRLENLKNPILFLRNLRNITICVVPNEKNDDIEISMYNKKLIETEEYTHDCYDVTMEHYQLDERGESNDIFLFSQCVTITDANGKKNDHLIYVGFFYDRTEKKLITNQKRQVYCFFPTKETFNCCFISHAPFLLTDNRQNLKPDEVLNKGLVKLLSSLAVYAVLSLRDYGLEHGNLLIDENISDIITDYDFCYSYKSDEIFEGSMHDAFEKMLEKERIILSRNNKYLSLEESFVGSPRELMDLLSQDQLAELKRVHKTESCNPNNIDFIKWELATKIYKREGDLFNSLGRYSSENFATDITPDFMKKQDSKWVTKMYTFLRTAAPKLWKATEYDKKNAFAGLLFRYAPIIKTQKGEWVSPYIKGNIQNVYYPLNSGENKDYNFIAEEYLRIETAKKFFDELEIKQPDEYDYIQSVMLPRYEGENLKGDLKSDFDFLLSYYYKADQDKQKSLISDLRSKYFLCGSDGLFRRPDTLYFRSKMIERYLTAL